MIKALKTDYKRINRENTMALEVPPNLQDEFKVISLMGPDKLFMYGYVIYYNLSKPVKELSFTGYTYENAIEKISNFFEFALPEMEDHNRKIANLKHNDFVIEERRIDKLLRNRVMLRQEIQVVEAY